MPARSKCRCRFGSEPAFQAVLYEFDPRHLLEVQERDSGPVVRHLLAKEALTSSILVCRSRACVKWCQGWKPVMGRSPLSIPRASLDLAGRWTEWQGASLQTKISRVRFSSSPPRLRSTTEVQAASTGKVGGSIPSEGTLSSSRWPGPSLRSSRPRFDPLRGDRFTFHPLVPVVSRAADCDSACPSSILGERTMPSTRWPRDFGFDPKRHGSNPCEGTRHRGYRMVRELFHTQYQVGSTPSSATLLGLRSTVGHAALTR